MKQILALCFITFSLLTLPFAFADEGGKGRAHEGLPNSKVPLTATIVKPNEVVFEVHGIVCSFCSMGVERKLSKLSFIDRTKYGNGVRVTIEEQKVTAAIKSGESVDINAAYDAIKSGGYEPAHAYVAGEDGSVIIFNAEGKQCEVVTAC